MTTTPAALDVVGIGNAIVDVLSQSDDAFLESQGLTKGTMALIDEPLAIEKSVVALGEHINDGVANANDIKGCRGGGHALSSARLGPWMGSSTTMV